MPKFRNRTRLFLWFLSLISLCFGNSFLASSTHAVETKKLSQTKQNTILKFNDLVINRPIFSVFILPKEIQHISTQSDINHNVQIISNAGKLTQNGTKSWKWQAPEEPGLYTIDVKVDENVVIHLNVFVLIPYEDTKNGKLDGYLIGEYPDEPLKGLSTYNVPKGFIRVTDDNKNIQLTPHFSLSQFLCKQKLHGAQFIVLQEKLLFVLEDFVDFLAMKGHPVNSLNIMSGYRTPYYNAKIGNKTTYSRHVWGDAVDIFIDESPKDGYLDDLNHDGKTNNADINLLYQWMETFQKQYEGTQFIGGLARYHIKGKRTPFVHLDTRGYKARWKG